MTENRKQEITNLFSLKQYLAGGIYSMEGGIIWECLGEVKRLEASNAKLRGALTVGQSIVCAFTCAMTPERQREIEDLITKYGGPLQCVDWILKDLDAARMAHASAEYCKHLQSEIERLEADCREKDEEAKWIRRKLKLPEDIASVEVYGKMHVVVHGNDELKTLLPLIDQRNRERLKQISAFEIRHIALLKQNMQQEDEIDALEQRNRELEAIQAQANAILDNHRKIVEAKDAEILKLRTALTNYDGHTLPCASRYAIFTTTKSGKPCDCVSEEALKSEEQR